MGKNAVMFNCVQLTFEKHGFGLSGSIYMEIFIEESGPTQFNIMLFRVNCMQESNKASKIFNKWI